MINNNSKNNTNEIRGRPVSYSESYISNIDDLKKMSIMSNSEFRKSETFSEINYLQFPIKNDEPLLNDLTTTINPVNEGIFSINRNDSNIDLESNIKKIKSFDSLEKESKLEKKEYEPFRYKDKCEMIINKLMLFFIHLFLISLFELVFFFLFVTKYEDTSLNGVFKSITESATSVCNNLTISDKQIVDYVINLVINGTELLNESNENNNIRNELNKKLFINAILYFIGVFLINLIIIVLNVFYYKRRMNFKGILLDNLVMITFLGLYEYAFFSTIVFNYVTITPQELEYNIYNNAIQNC